MSGIWHSAVIPKKCSTLEIIEWCTKHYGPQSFLHGRWVSLDHTIQFKREADRNWFLLRWST